MTLTEFFQQNQQDWFEEFVDHEVREIQSDMTTHDEIFEFDPDVFSQYNNIFNSAETK